MGVLTTFSGANKPHPHLNRLLLTFHLNGAYYLLSNWADYNLRQFWALHPLPASNHVDVRWVMKQCHGLASSLQALYRRPLTSDSWLGDSVSFSLRPESILWYRTPSRFVLSDYGRPRSVIQSSHPKLSAPIEGYSPAYRPPEEDMHSTKTPQYSSWSLGCLFLEIVSWLILGDATTSSEFGIERTNDDIYSGYNIGEAKFFNIIPHPTDGHRYPVVKESVKRVRSVVSSQSLWCNFLIPSSGF